MKIQEEKQNDILILQPEAELMGGDETEVLQECCFRAIQEGTTKIVLKMDKIKWMNSAGLGMLIAGLKILRESGGDIRLAIVPVRIKRTIEITGIDKVIHIFKSLNDAIKSYSKEATDDQIDS
jgi:anti-sigma B factor antagonist